MGNTRIVGRQWKWTCSRASWEGNGIVGDTKNYGVNEVVDTWGIVGEVRS